MMLKRTSLLLSILAVLAAGCSGNGRDSEPGRTGDGLTIFVTVAPQAGIVKSIGGKFVDVKVLVTGGSCPEAFSPSPKQMASLYGADAFLRLGFPFEDLWLSKVAAAHNSTKVISMSDGIRILENGAEEHNVEEHGEARHGDTQHADQHHEAEDHRHGHRDPHVWMSVRNLAQMARNTTRILSELAPQNKTYFEQNLKSYLSRTESLDKELAKRFKGLKNRTIFVFHPVFGYLAEDYGLKQVAIESEGKEPSAKQLVTLMRAFREHKADTIFVQEGSNPKAAQAVARALGARMIALPVQEEDALKSIEEFVARWK